jgi:F-type H+-transporting ATPase subunit gamma
VIDNPSSSGANIIAEDISEDFVNNVIDRIEIVTTRFNNMMSYSVQDWQILPIEVEKEEHYEPEALMEFTPNKTSILQKLVPMFITNSIFQALLEANASELASRMTAMSSASNNADEMIKNLTVAYNKARQGAITQELIEIVSGASAQAK